MGKPLGSAKTGGRRRGARNRRSAEARALAARLNIDPFEVLLRLAANDWRGLGYSAPGISLEIRLKAARDACEYLYPRPKAVEFDPPNGGAPTLAEAVRRIYETAPQNGDDGRRLC